MLHAVDGRIRRAVYATAHARVPQPLEPGPLPLPGSVAGLLVLGALLALPAALPSRVREATP